MSRILFFGPYPPVVTGQSIAFKEVYDNYKGDKQLFDTTRFGEHKLLNTIYCLCKLPLVFAFSNFDKVYFTCTRSNLGFLKDFMLLVMCKVTNRKSVNHLHGADFKSFYRQGKYIKPFIKWAYNSVGTSIVLLPEMKCQFEEFPSMQIKVVSNCYPRELDNYQTILEEKKNQLLYLSNIMESKGILIFLKSASCILERFDGIIIKIAGLPMGDFLSSENQIRRKFQESFNNLKSKYPNRIFYLGAVQGSDKIKLLQESSIFVLPTFYPTEALPISILEAMRCGNAIITTNHNYLGSIVSEQNGCLVTPKSVEELTECISELLNDSEKLSSIAKYNVEYAAANFSFENFNNKIDSIISNL